MYRAICAEAAEAWAKNGTAYKSGHAASQVHHTGAGVVNGASAK